MALKHPELFKPYNIGKLRIKNRVTMAPMHLGGRMDSNGNMTDEVIDYFEARAKGGFGLIITGGYGCAGGAEKTTASQNPMGDIVTFNTSIKKVAEKVHAYDTKLFVEVGPPFGRVAFLETLAPEMNGRPVAPSEVPARWNPSIMCRALTTEECQALIDNQIEAALIAARAGADGILLSGPYGGYFADQFAVRAFNKRDDEFGFAKGGQYRVFTDVIKGIKDAMGQDYPVMLRLAIRHYMKDIGVAPLPGEEFTEMGRGLEDSLDLAKALEAAGADGLLVASGCYDSFHWLYPPTYMKDGLWLEDAKKVTDVVNIPVICPGKINDPKMAEDAIKGGFADAIALGKASLADAEWANKARMGKDEDIRPCIGCQNGCMSRVFNGGLVTCAVNPALFYEKSDPITPAMTKKHVVIIGGGVGGMEAALVAAQRGHSVDLYEKNDKLGGNFIVAAVPEFKYGDHKLLEWFPTQLKKAGVNVHLNSKIDVKDIDGLKADEIIVATGAVPKSFKIDGVDTITSSEVLLGKEVGDNCVIIGGGLVGCETAVWLAKKGKKVSIVEALPGVMMGGAVATPNFLMMLDMLAGEGITVYTSARFVKAEGGKAYITDADGKEVVLDADSIIQSVGFAADDALYTELEKNCPVPVWNVGDSRVATNVMEAVRAGFFVGKSI